MSFAIQETTKPIPRAQGIRIAYASELVDKLQADHKTLLTIFVQIQDAAADRDITTLKSKLAQFTSGLNAHILLENIRLYVFLKHRLAADPTQGALVARFRKEMGGIAVDVMDFVEHYRALEFWDLARWIKLQADLHALGQILVNRIADEEKRLYPLYQPEGV